jgi:hypothetical protein
MLTPWHILILRREKIIANNRPCQLIQAYKVSNVAHQRGRERHSGKHEKLASRPPLHAVVRRRLITPGLLPYISSLFS